MQVGDRIISVDGQRIIGYSYDKTRNLLQQAKARGSVSLMVVSQQEGGQKSNEQKPRKTEGVILRQKNRGSKCTVVLFKSVVIKKHYLRKILYHYIITNIMTSPLHHA